MPILPSSNESRRPKRCSGQRRIESLSVLWRRADLVLERKEFDFSIAERDIKLLQAVEDWIRLQTHNNVVDYRLLTSEEEKRRRKDFSKAIRRLASRFDEYN